MMFFRVNLDLIKNFDAPFIAEVGDENVCTLLVLAAYMDANGNCWPTQETIGYMLGISAHSAGKRIRKLAQCTYQGKPIIEITKSRPQSNQFERNHYRVTTDLVSIFGSAYGN